MTIAADAHDPEVIRVNEATRAGRVPQRRHVVIIPEAAGSRDEP